MKKNHSVVILTYNQDWQLSKLLKALDNQTILPFEVIIINNNGVDPEINEIYKFPVIIKNLHYESEFDKRAYARNVGYEIASGDIITFFDCDAFPYKNYIELTQKLLKEKMLLYGKRYEVYENYFDKIEELQDNIFETFSSDMHDEHIKAEWNINSLLFCSNNFSLYKTNEQLFDETFEGWGYEDTELGYRYFKNGYETIRSENLVVGHFHHSDIMSDKQRKSAIMNANYFLHKFPNEDVRYQLAKDFKAFEIDESVINNIWKEVNAS
jgi:glycosyltransferase involved in cell wall biosynthesis